MFYLFKRVKALTQLIHLCLEPPFQLFSLFYSILYILYFFSTNKIYTICIQRTLYTSYTQYIQRIPNIPNIHLCLEPVFNFFFSTLFHPIYSIYFVYSIYSMYPKYTLMSRTRFQLFFFSTNTIYTIYIQHILYTVIPRLT